MRDPARPRGSGAGIGLLLAGVPAADSLWTTGPSENGTMCSAAELGWPDLPWDLQAEGTLWQEPSPRPPVTPWSCVSDRQGSW